MSICALGQSQPKAIASLKSNTSTSLSCLSTFSLFICSPESQIASLLLPFSVEILYLFFKILSTFSRILSSTCPNFIGS